LWTINPIYKRVRLDSHDDPNTKEHRDELIFQTTLLPIETLEVFFKYDTYEGDKKNAPYTLHPTHHLFRGEVRTRIPSLRLSLTPMVEYAEDHYKPDSTELITRKAFVDIGFDLTKKLHLSYKPEFVYLTDIDPDANPSHVHAKAMYFHHKATYELFKNIDVTMGSDYARGIQMNAFNSWSLFGEVTLFKPGIVRSTLGYSYTGYYNIGDGISSVYWKFFLFM